MPKKAAISKTIASKTKTPKTTKNTQKTEKATATKKKAKSPCKTIKKGTIAAINDKIITKSRGEMRFALYLRKSTEDENNQINSIKDQERVCRDFAARQGNINIVIVFQEDASAAYAGNRAEFDKMLSMVEDGKIDAILAYHPDRLSRNMLEAGKILDMLKANKNKGETMPILQDLVFPTVAFHNDSGGRLMLAVLFSMATQYSEHLSEMISRGVNSNLSRGISSGSPKWGYQRDELTGLYTPDKNFNIIKQGWKMALDGKSQVEILNFWKQNGVSRMTKISRGKAPKQVSLGSTSAVSRVFNDPIYTGTLCQKDQQVNLLEIDSNFKPMVSEEEYNQVQTMYGNKSRLHNLQKGSEEFIMFKGGIVRCAECGSPLQGYYSGHSKDHRFLYFGHRSKTEASKNCPRLKETTYITQTINGETKQVKVPKEIRAKVILDALYEALDSIKPTKADYKQYLAVANQYASEKTEELRIEKCSLSGKLAHLRKELSEEERSYKAISLIPNTPEATLNSSAQRLMNLQSEIVDTETKLAELKIKLQKPEQAVMSEKEFLNLLKTAADEMRNRNMVGKDILFRKIFLNAQINKQNEVVFLCKPEFNNLIKTGIISLGGVAGTLTLDPRLAKAVL